MTIRRLVALAVAVAACGCTTAPPPGTTAGESADLRVRFSGVRAGAGAVVCAIYAGRESFEGADQPLRSATLPAAAEAGEVVEWEVELPYGAYAVKAYHDLNGNGELDRGAFGVPAEPYGFSNNARGVFGPPSWAAARVELDRREIALEIRLE